MRLTLTFFNVFVLVKQYGIKIQCLKFDLTVTDVNIFILFCGDERKCIRLEPHLQKNNNNTYGLYSVINYLNLNN